MIVVKSILYLYRLSIIKVVIYQMVYDRVLYLNTYYYILQVLKYLSYNYLLNSVHWIPKIMTIYSINIRYILQNILYIIRTFKLMVKFVVTVHIPI